MATTSEAVSDTVLKQVEIRSAQRLYADLQPLLYEVTSIAGAQIADAYRMVEVTTPAISFLLCSFGPLVFAIILLKAAATFDALALKYSK
ncbi:hypothetical protein ACLKA7_001887 [Drosophila subpalustris]